MNKNIVDKAVAYARQRGIDLSSLIEDYLKRLTNEPDPAAQTPVPDIVLSLLGAGEAVGEDDLNGRDAYHRYQEEKYR